MNFVKRSSLAVGTFLFIFFLFACNNQNSATDKDQFTLLVIDEFFQLEEEWTSDIQWIAIEPEWYETLNQSEQQNLQQAIEQVYQTSLRVESLDPLIEESEAETNNEAEYEYGSWWMDGVYITIENFNSRMFRSYSFDAALYRAVNDYSQFENNTIKYSDSWNDLEWGDGTHVITD